jgi:hypothetical protein
LLHDYLHYLQRDQQPALDAGSHLPPHRHGVDGLLFRRSVVAAVRIGVGAVAKDLFRSIPPKNSLNTPLFFDFASQNQKTKACSHFILQADAAKCF